MGTSGDLDPPPPVVEIARRLEEAGYETWCVGGAVRDALLGQPHLDWDLATSATPQEVRRLFRRTVPVGIDFGTVGVLDDSGLMHEVTTFRRDVKTDGRHAVVEFGASLDEDLARRDFTINAIAYSPGRRRLHDPFGGRADLDRRLVRAVGVPGDRMREDRLRALRALRFAARFGFEIEPETWRAIVESAPHLTRLSAERVKQELEKTMAQVERPGRALRLWRDSGALGVLVPALRGLPDDHISALDFLPPPGPPRRPQRVLDRLAMLFVALQGPEAERVLRALRFSNAESRWLRELVERWPDFVERLQAALGAGGATDADLRRVASGAGRLRLGPLFRLAAARWRARRETGVAAPAAGAVASLYRRALRVAYRDPIELADLAVNGDDLRAIGIPPGPVIGKILLALLDAVIEDPSLNTRDRLLALARRIGDEKRGGGAAS